MNRTITANLGWILIIIGVLFTCFAYYLIGLSILFFGFFLRLIYNSEKYKFFKYLHLQLLKAYGATMVQKNFMTNCLWGFYKAVVDLIFIVILPFFIYPLLNVNWIVGGIIGIVYIIALKPVFKPLDSVDKEIADSIISEIRQHETI